MQLLNVTELNKKLNLHQIKTWNELQDHIVAENSNEEALKCTCSSSKNMNLKKCQEHIRIYSCKFCDKSKRIKIINSKLKCNLSILKQIYFLLYFKDGLSFDTISRYLDISKPTTSKLVKSLHILLYEYYRDSSVKIGGDRRR